MRHRRTVPCVVILLTILVSVCGSRLVSGQGGTGREPPKSGGPTTQPKRPIRSTTQPAKSRQTALPIEMVLIPAGTFTMGSPDSEVERSNDEGCGNYGVLCARPPHLVSVQSFYMGKYEVTQAQYRAVMETNPSYFRGDNLPVEKVTWNDAVEFCRRLSQMTGKAYRLPSEAEWEYACRAGTQTPFAFGSSLSSRQANFNGTLPYGAAAKGVYRQKTTPVGSFRPNAFGLYDMHGNVWEWCEDWSNGNYDGSPTDGSAWLSGRDQEIRVVRGGSWDDSSPHLLSATRFGILKGVRGSYNGFRIVAVVPTR